MKSLIKIQKLLMIALLVGLFGTSYGANYTLDDPALPALSEPASTTAATDVKPTETTTTETTTPVEQPGSWKTSGNVYDKYEWGVMGFVGIMTTNEMYHDFVFDYGSLGPGMLYSIELDRQLSTNNWARRYLAPLLFASTIETAINVTYETDPTGPLWEVNPYVMFRWREFPWNNTVLTTFGFGEGVSYATHIPQQELDSEDGDGYARRFLNYLAAEVTFSLPSHPEWQIIYRLHHRSSVFGLYAPGTEGSTAAGIAVRYWME